MRYVISSQSPPEFCDRVLLPRYVLELVLPMDQTVSNLLFLLNIFETVVASCLKCHLNIHGLHDNHQPAHRPGYVEALVNKCMAAIVLLNFSADFEYTSGVTEVLYPGFNPISVTESSPLQSELAHQKVYS